jgi:hypothetical protein
LPRSIAPPIGRAMRIISSTARPIPASLTIKTGGSAPSAPWAARILLRSRKIIMTVTILC